MGLRESAKAASATWPQDDDASRALAAACSPEVILALLDVADAAAGTYRVVPSAKSRWWREDGMAGSALADKRLRMALDRWKELAT